MFTLEEAKVQIIEILTDASGVTINNEIIFDLADTNGIKDLIKNSMIKDKLMLSPELLLKKDTTLYMYDSSVVDIKVQEEGFTIAWHESIGDLLPAAQDSEAEAPPMPAGAIAPRKTKEPENFWPFMLCKAIIRKLHTHLGDTDKPNFRSYYSVLQFLATKYNMCIDRLIKTNPIELIPFNTLQEILSTHTANYLWGRKLYDDRFLKEKEYPMVSLRDLELKGFSKNTENTLYTIPEVYDEPLCSNYKFR